MSFRAEQRRAGPGHPSPTSVAGAGRAEGPRPGSGLTDGGGIFYRGWVCVSLHRDKRALSSPGRRLPAAALTHPACGRREARAARGNDADSAPTHPDG